MGHDALTKLFFWMEDFDNNELPEAERNEQLEEAVRDYNEDNQTEHDPATSVKRYWSWQMNRYDQ